MKKILILLAFVGAVYYGFFREKENESVTELREIRENIKNKTKKDEAQRRKNELATKEARKLQEMNRFNRPKQNLAPARPVPAEIRPPEPIVRRYDSPYDDATSDNYYYNDDDDYRKNREGNFDSDPYKDDYKDNYEDNYNQENDNNNGQTFESDINKDSAIFNDSENENYDQTNNYNESREQVNDNYEEPVNEPVAQAYHFIDSEPLPDNLYIPGAEHGPIEGESIDHIYHPEGK